MLEPMKDNFRRIQLKLRFIMLFIFIASAINVAQTIVQNNKGLRLFYVAYTSNWWLPDHVN